MKKETVKRSLNWQNFVFKSYRKNTHLNKNSLPILFKIPLFIKTKNDYISNMVSFKTGVGSRDAKMLKVTIVI